MHLSTLETCYNKSVMRRSPAPRDIEVISFPSCHSRENGNLCICVDKNWILPHHVGDRLCQARNDKTEIVLLTHSSNEFRSQ